MSTKLKQISAQHTQNGESVRSTFPDCIVIFVLRKLISANKWAVDSFSNEYEKCVPASLNEEKKFCCNEILHTILISAFFSCVNITSNIYGFFNFEFKRYKKLFEEQNLDFKCYNNDKNAISSRFESIKLLRDKIAAHNALYRPLIKPVKNKKLDNNSDMNTALHYLAGSNVHRDTELVFSLGAYSVSDGINSPSYKLSQFQPSNFLKDSEEIIELWVNLLNKITEDFFQKDTIYKDKNIKEIDLY